MACSFPISAWQVESGEVVFVERERVTRSLFLPCGQCAQCRLERARQWAVRCVHESKLYDFNAFITLTYDDAHLPLDRGLRYRDFQLFMKRLRRRFSLSTIRFYMCGEYGEDRDSKGRVTGLLGRPHYHALLFNMNFADKLYFKKVGDFVLYTSKTLSELWPLGNHLIGDVSFQSASYCARYCMETVNGDPGVTRYRLVDSRTGEIVLRAREFSQMSRKPGIGAPWLRKFMSDVYPNGEVVSNGRLAKSPRYYDVVFKREGGDDGWMQLQRYRRGSAHPEDQTDERLLVMEKVTRAKLSQLIRSL